MSKEEFTALMARLDERIASFQQTLEKQAKELEEAIERFCNLCQQMEESWPRCDDLPRIDDVDL